MAVRLKDHLNDPVTQHMRPEFVGLRSDQTVGEALAALRTQPPAGRILYFYVLDAENRLHGVLPTRRLLLSPLDRPVSDIMVRHVVAIPATATVLDACEFFTLHRLLAFPVVDEERHVLGIVDVDLYTEGLSEVGGGEEEGGLGRGDDLFQLIGVHVSQARPVSLRAAFRNRLPWLLCSLGGGVVAALLSWLYQAELQSTVALALFIPVVLGLAESMSIQSVSLALQALHGQPPHGSGFLLRLRRELMTGLALGVACGLLVGVIALVWLGRLRVGLSLFGGIAGGVTGAAVLGLTLPNLLRRLRLDPRVAAGPVALALADMLSILLYLNLARWLLR
jgi:magnesium transporter